MSQDSEIGVERDGQEIRDRVLELITDLPKLLDTTVGDYFAARGKELVEWKGEREAVEAYKRLTLHTAPVDTGCNFLSYEVLYLI